MKTYNLPISWVQQGAVQVNAETLEEAINKLQDVEMGTLGIIGKTIPRSTKVSYPMLKDFVKDETLSNIVTLYTSSKMPKCPYCDKARDFFRENNIEFEEVDVITNQERANSINTRSNSFAVPQVEVGNEVFVGFTEQVVKTALIRYGYLKEIEGEQGENQSLPPSPPPADMPEPSEIPRKKVTSKELLEKLQINEATKQILNVVSDPKEDAAYVQTSDDGWFRVDSNEIESALKLVKEDKKPDNAKEKETINA